MAKDPNDKDNPFDFNNAMARYASWSLVLILKAALLGTCQLAAYKNYKLFHAGQAYALQKDETAVAKIKALRP